MEYDGMWILSKYLSLFILCGLVSGCFEYNQWLTVNKDGSFRYVIQLAYEKSGLLAFEAKASADECNENLAPIVTNSEVSLELLSADIRPVGISDNYVVCDYLLTGNVENELSWELAVKNLERVYPLSDGDYEVLSLDVSILKQGENAFMLTARHNVLPRTDIDPQAEAMNDCEKDFKWKVSVPKLISTNGVREQVDKVVWNVCSSQVKKGYPYTREFFVLFSTDVGLVEKLLKPISRMFE